MGEIHSKRPSPGIKKRLPAASLICVLMALALLLTVPGQSRAAGSTDATRDRYGLSALWGNIGDPARDQGQAFFLANVFALVDYERVWSHPAPEELRFKVEASLGGTYRERFRVMASAGILAFHYLPWLRTARLSPYVEAGVGLIYSGFRVKGQGLDVNFNPQAGLGVEVASERGTTYFISFRVHHMSNGGLHPDNRGVNSGVVQIGRYL